MGRMISNAQSWGGGRGGSSRCGLRGPGLSPAFKLMIWTFWCRGERSCVVKLKLSRSDSEKVSMWLGGRSVTNEFSQGIREWRRGNGRTNESLDRSMCYSFFWGEAELSWEESLWYHSFDLPSLSFLFIFFFFLAGDCDLESDNKGCFGTESEPDKWWEVVQETRSDELCVASIRIKANFNGAVQFFPHLFQKASTMGIDANAMSFPKEKRQREWLLDGRGLLLHLVQHLKKPHDFSIN